MKYYWVRIYDYKVIMPNTVKSGKNLTDMQMRCHKKRG